MLFLKKPKISCKCILYDLIPLLPIINKEKVFRESIECNKKDIIFEMQEYDSKAETGGLYQIKNTIDNYRDLKELDLNPLYVTLRDKEKKKYQEILSYDKYKRCPYCEKRPANQIDHHLPKSKFPLHSITPCNLVPICSECNRLKGNDCNPMVHPYYDYTSKQQWLYCDIERVEDQFAIRFRLDFQSIVILEPKLVDKIEYTFNKMKIAKYYQGEALVTLGNIENSLIRAEKVGKDALIELVENYKNDCNFDFNTINGFYFAFYSGLLSFIMNRPYTERIFM